MLSQIISTTHFNWQTGAACVAANLLSQQLLGKIGPSDESIPFQNEISAFFMGCGMVTAAAKPLQNYFSIPIQPLAIVPISLFATIVQVVSKVLFPLTIEEPEKVNQIIQEFLESL